MKDKDKKNAILKLLLLPIHWDAKLDLKKMLFINFSLWRSFKTQKFLLHFPKNITLRKNSKEYKRINFYLSKLITQSHWNVSFVVVHGFRKL